MTLSYRWTIVAVGALMTCVALGAMFSLAVFLDPLSRDTGWSRAGVSAAMTMNFLVMGAGAFGWGAVSDRYGTRIVVMIGRSAARARAGVGEQGHVAPAVPADLRNSRGSRGQYVLRADDRCHDGVVRHATQSRRFARVGRHGSGAADDLAVRALADHCVRLAHGDVRRSACSPGCC